MANVNISTYQKITEQSSINLETVQWFQNSVKQLMVYRVERKAELPYVV